MSVEEEGENEGEKEEDGVHDAQYPRCLQHGAVLVDVEGPV